MDNFENLCRVCQCKPDGKTMVALSKEQMGKLELIGDCTKRVHSEDQAKYICMECESKLDVVYDFVRSCRRLDVNGPDEAVEAGIPKTKSHSPSLSKGTSSDVTKKHCETQTIYSFLSRSSGQLNSNLGGFRTTKLVDSGSSFRPKSNDKFKSQRDSKSTLRIRLKSMEESVKECYFCGKQFSSRANMLRHVREHLGRRFICEYENCNSTFTQQSSLDTHNFIHRGFKPFACESCDKRFTQSKSLNFHKRTHTGEKPFTCGYCQASFIQRSNLIRHFKMIKACWKNKQKRPAKKFQCQQCSKCLASKQSLLRHQHTHEQMAELITGI